MLFRKNKKPSDDSRAKKPKKKKKYKLKGYGKPTLATTAMIAIFLIICIVGIIMSRSNPPVIAENEIKVISVDVGQGDCSLIMSNKGNILIDSGPPDNEARLISYIKSLGITAFEYAVFTHPHEDHIGGGDGIVRYFDVKNIIMTDTVSESSIYGDLLTAIEKSDAKVYRAVPGDVYSCGDIRMKILAPNSDTYPSDEINNRSIVLKLTFGDGSLLFTGDAGAPSENELMEKFKSELDADILKVAHHGSNSSTSEEFLECVTPKVAFISCAKNNSYGHPGSYTLKRLKKAGAVIYRTDLEGTVMLTLDDAGNIR